MLVKEYRIPLPLTVEEYRIAQLYMIAKKSRQETTSHSAAATEEKSGVEILVNEPYSNGPGPANDGNGCGQFTHKVYHIGSHLPGWFKALLPKSALTVEEKAWNAYPYTKTVFSCPFVEKFSLEIETYYTPDGGEQENVFNLKGSDLSGRVTDLIDVVKDQQQNYVPEEDPTVFVSEKTARGPLDENWLEEYSAACVGKKMPTADGRAIMCAYKLCKVEFRYWGMQAKIEQFIHNMALRNTMLRAHRQAWVWQDEWYGLTMDDIRAIERQTAEELKKKMRGEVDAEEDEEALQDEEALRSLQSIESSQMDAPNIIPRGSEMVSRRSLCNSDEGDSEGRRREAREGSHSHLESLLGENGSDDEFYDCPEDPEDLRSLTKWNSNELVGEETFEESRTAPVRQGSLEPEFLGTREPPRRALSQHATGSRPLSHPTIGVPKRLSYISSLWNTDICREAQEFEPACPTSILILVVHGGSVLDGDTDLAVRKSDVTTFRGAFESVIRQHFPALVGRLVIKCVPCPSICSTALASVTSMSPYSFDRSAEVSNERLPVHCLPLLATASPSYFKSVDQVIVAANRVYQDFLGSEDGSGFSGQVCLIGDSVGSILSYDALCRKVRRTSEGSGGDADHLRRSVSPHIVEDHLAASSIGEDNHALQFEVSDFFIFGSALGLVLAHRRLSAPLSNLPTPSCGQVYNLFHPSNPVTTRLEPLLSAQFSRLAPVNVPRYRQYPTGDGTVPGLVEVIQANPLLFNEPSWTTGRGRRSSNESVQSGIFDTQQMQAVTSLRAKWWGSKRLDYALYCPEGLANFPTNSLPHLFHSSYWESTDVIAFILRQLISPENSLPHTGESLPETGRMFTPNQPREKWLKKRTSIKVRNRAANHRANDVIVLEGRDQLIQGRFSYGPLDMAALSSELVDVHIMKEPPSGEWTFLTTETTDRNGRVQCSLAQKDAMGYGVYPVKMVVRGDHTSLDLHIAVLPPKTEVVVFSIDGSFTASVSVTGKDPKVRPSSVDVVRHWQDLGYLIIYVTGRPCMQLQKVVSWLSMHNFPHGLVSFADGFNVDPLRHKTEFLRGLQQDHQVVLAAGYGSSKDISVYSSLGIQPSNIHIVGKVSKKQMASCNPLTEGYAAHLTKISSPGGSVPAQGNARMVIPRTCFGLPGQFQHQPVPLRHRTQLSLRTNSKKYNSAPPSAAPSSATFMS